MTSCGPDASPTRWRSPPGSTRTPRRWRALRARLRGVSRWARSRRGRSRATRRPACSGSPSDRALINRMGFNNHGAGRWRRLLRASLRPGAAGREPREEQGHAARARGGRLRRAGWSALAPLADYLVVNASSPNTPGLRAAPGAGAAPRACSATVKERLDAVSPGTPAVPQDRAGPLRPRRWTPRWTWRSRSASPASSAPTPPSPGPACAAPWRRRPAGSPGRRSRRSRWRRCGARPRAPGGGSRSGPRAGSSPPTTSSERLEAGADLVQVYTAFVYEGPAFVSKLLGDLRSRLVARGLGALPRPRGTPGPGEPRTRSG